MAETLPAGSRPALLSPWRRRVQWSTTLLVLLLPWLHIDGNSLLRLDIPRQRLYLFGQVVRIEELYLVLLGGLALIIGFLLVTVVVGRVWCGWFCPQTTLSDLAEWAARRLGLKLGQQRFEGPLWRRLLLQSGFAVLALLVACNLLWYFIEPRLFFRQLAHLDLHYAAWILLVTTALLVWLDLAVVRRLMCREFCPYGRFQTALVDRATLTLQLPASELSRCIDCGSCVRSCPMGIDIRRGDQVECINCGRCLDACRQVMAKRQQPGLISYRFGKNGEGVRGLRNPRLVLLAVAFLALVIGFGVALQTRLPVSLKVAISHTASPRQLADGQVATFVNAWLNNRSGSDIACRLQAVRSDDNAPIALKGQVRATLRPGENRRLDFVAVAPAQPRTTITLQLLDLDGRVLTTADLILTGSQEKP